MKSLFYFKREEAERLKDTYSSWIGKQAHTGKGKKQVLININIVQRKLYKGSRDASNYRIEFLFDNNVTLSAYEFLFYNSLVASGGFKEEQDSRPESAA